MMQLGSQLKESQDHGISQSKSSFGGSGGKSGSKFILFVGKIHFLAVGGLNPPLPCCASRSAIFFPRGHLHYLTSGPLQLCVSNGVSNPPSN